MTPKILPVKNKPCQFANLNPAGKPILCGKPATMSFNGTALCDRHAELAMCAACGLPVTIQR